MPSQAFGLVALAKSADVIAGIEGIQQDRVDRLCGPEAQRVDALAAPADDRRVEGRGDHAFRRLPDVALQAAVVLDGRHRAAETDFVGSFAAFEFPGVAVGEPGFRQFHLPAVGHLLAEQAMDVANAVAIGRNIDGRHGFHETGGKPAEAAVTERRIRLDRRDHVKIDAERLQRVVQLAHQLEVRNGVAHQPADQELERQVVDPLVAGCVDLLRGFHPLVDDAVADDEDGGGQPVVRLGGLGVLADAVGELFDDFFGENFGVRNTWCWRRQIGFQNVVRHRNHQYFCKPIRVLGSHRSSN
jgi:hypothetical protein